MRYRFGQAEVRTQGRELVIDGVVTPLGGRAFDLLLVLIERRTRVVTTREIFSLVWPGLAVQPNNLQVQIWTLRGLLGFGTIATVARRGYQFAVPVETLPDAGLATDVPRPDAMTPSPHGAPASAWSIETAIVCAELGPHRLVTLIGADDRSRRGLAMSVAGHLACHMRGGIWYIDVPALARATDERPVSDLEHFIRRLRVRDALFVLINADHAAVTARRLVTRLLPLPKTQLLATSREPLRLDGEHVLPAPRRHDALAVPAPCRAGLRWRTR